MMFFPFRGVLYALAAISALATLSWFGHELVSGSAAKNELQNVRSAAVQSVEKLNRVTQSNIELNELQNATLDQLELSKNRVKEIQRKLDNVNNAESECPENCKLSF